MLIIHVQIKLQFHAHVSGVILDFLYLSRLPPISNQSLSPLDIYLRSLILDISLNSLAFCPLHVQDRFNCNIIHILQSRTFSFRAYLYGPLATSRWGERYSMYSIYLNKFPAQLTVYIKDITNPIYNIFALNELVKMSSFCKKISLSKS